MDAVSVGSLATCHSPILKLPFGDCSSAPRSGHEPAAFLASAEGVVPADAFRLRLWRKDQRWRKDKGGTGRATPFAPQGAKTP